MSKPVNPNYLLWTGGVALLVGVVLRAFFPLAGVCVFALGALAYMVARMALTPRDGDFRQRRLFRLLLVVLLLYVASAVMMYRNNDLWVLLLLTAAVTDLFLTFRQGQK